MLPYGPGVSYLSHAYHAGIEAGALPGDLQPDRGPPAADAAAQRRYPAVLCRHCAVQGNPRWPAQGWDPPAGRTYTGQGPPPEGLRTAISAADADYTSTVDLPTGAITLHLGEWPQLIRF